MKPVQKTALIAVLALIVGFFIGMQYKAYQVRSALLEGLEEIGNSFNSNEEIDTSEVNMEESQLIPKTMGEEVQLATVMFKVNSAKESDVITSEYSSPKAAKEGAKFVIVDLDMTNTTKETFWHEDDGFVLMDQSERVFEPYGDTIGNIDNYLAMRDLGPNITEKGVMVFEVPDDATSYSLNIGKAGTSEVYSVRLK